MTRSTRYRKIYTMLVYVMGKIMSGMGPISTSPITTNSFSNVARIKVVGIFRPRSTSATINYCITPQVTIITTYISPIITIITTDITFLRSMTTMYLPLSSLWKISSTWQEGHEIPKNIPWYHVKHKEEWLVWDLYPPLPSTSTLSTRLWEE